MKKALLLLSLVCPLLFAAKAHAQDFSVNNNFTYPRAGESAKLPANTTFSQWIMFWNPQGNLTSCSVQVTRHRMASLGLAADCFPLRLAQMWG